MKWLRNAVNPGAEPSVEAEAAGSQLPRSGEGTDSGRVIGERAESVVSRPPSLQSRLTNVMAAALFGSLALGFLIWYYVNLSQNRVMARTQAQTAVKSRADSEMAPPPLGRIDPPAPALAQVLGPPPEEPPPADTPEAWLRLADDPPSTRLPYPGVVSSQQATTKTPEELALERKLSGNAFTPAGVSPSVASSAAGADTARTGASDLDKYLAASATPMAQAQFLPTQRLLLGKGTPMDCTLETAIDSTLPGITTCVVPTDVFSTDGTVVLLERGTRLIGETRGQARQGSARIFVLWTEARPPSQPGMETGIVVPLASLGTDELGRSGLPGEVDRHFWDRFGAAILISVIDGGIQAAVQSQRDGGSDVIVSPTESREVMTEVLKSTIDIPPTVRKANGDRIQVLVARDLDFRSVYELRPTAARR